MPKTRVMPRGKRPPRAAAAVSKAINNVLLGVNNKNNQPAPRQPGPSRARPSFVPAHPKLRSSRGVGVKNIECIRVRNKTIKIKKYCRRAEI